MGNCYGTAVDTDFFIRMFNAETYSGNPIPFRHKKSLLEHMEGSVYQEGNQTDQKRRGDDSLLASKNE